MSEGPVGTGAPDHSDWRPRANPWLIAVTVTSAAFLEILDTTIVNVSLPHIAGSLSASIDEATWSLTSYLVANGIVLPISGWFGSVLGRKRYFLICIAMFTVSSMLCGFATSLPQLVLFRIMQGFFGGGLQPNQQSIILDTFPPAKRAAAFSVTAIATIVAPVLGPTLGGLITDHYSWRWIFFINVPVGIIAWIAVMRLVEDPPWAKATHGKGLKLDVDYIGLGLIALGLGCLEFVLDRGEQEGWLGSPLIRTFSLLAILGIVGAVCWLLSVKKPLVDLRVLKNRSFATGVLMISVFSAILFSSSILIPQMAQLYLGYTATLAGMLLSPAALMMIVLIPIVSRILPRVQTRFLIFLGFMMLSVAFYYGHSISPQEDYGGLLKLRLYQMLGMAFLFVPVSILAFATVPRESNRDAAALYSMFRNIAGSIGIAVSSAMVIERAQAHQAYMAEHMTPLEQPFLDSMAAHIAALVAQGMPAGAARAAANGFMAKTMILQSSIQAYLDVFTFCAVMALCAAPLAFLFPPGKSGGRPSPGAK